MKRCESFCIFSKLRFRDYIFYHFTIKSLSEIWKLHDDWSNGSDLHEQLTIAVYPGWEYRVRLYRSAVGQL